MQLGRAAGFDGKTLQSISTPVTGAVLFPVTMFAINNGDLLLASGA